MDANRFREQFVRAQIEAVHKALNKDEVPLKPKHARTLIVGTHKDKSSGVFWHTIGRIQLEKHPVLTWKFCHLVHKLLRDGYKTVPFESRHHIPRVQSLAQFWRHLNTSGYGLCIEAYCKLLIDKLKFHSKHPIINGKLEISEKDLRELETDVDSLFEMSIDLLDQMDNLLILQDRVNDMLQSLRWSSFIPQGQCILAPLIIVILDSSKYYDHLVKMIFKLHLKLPPDALDGHRARFGDIFRKTKKFYQEASVIEYFKLLVAIPTLPSHAPNFLQQTDLAEYRTPHAYLRTELPPEEGELLNISDETAREEEEPPQQNQASSDARQEEIMELQRRIEDEQFAKERLIQEARNRIEQYENRLKQMHEEMEHGKREAELAKEENEQLRNEIAARDASIEMSNDARIAEAESKAKLSSQKFEKMKGVYEAFRGEHVALLTKMSELQKKLDEMEKAGIDKDEKIAGLARSMEESKREEEKIQKNADGLVDEMRSQLAKADVEMEALLAKNKRLEEEATSRMRETSAQAIGEILDKCAEDLENATSISYPAHLAQAGMNELVSTFDSDQLLDALNAKDNIVAGHLMTKMLCAAASAAYTASIQSYDEVNEMCKKVLDDSKQLFAKPAARDAELSRLRSDLRSLNKLVAELPQNNDVDQEVVGSELDAEMKRMDEAIRRAVQEIEQLQKRARQETDGIRLEVNESILANCQQLMNVIMRLVMASRELQEEIVSSGRGGASPDEFYKRNHQWTEGLLSAAKAVGVAARVLVDSADGVVTGSAKFEQLIVAAQEIAASTAQLFVSSRVKADKDSKRLEELSNASRAVNQSTAQVVASVKSGKVRVTDEQSLDFSHLSLHAAKKEEMESQVRMLELEQELNQERERLAALRKQHYHMAQLTSEKE